MTAFDISPLPIVFVLIGFVIGCVLAIVVGIWIGMTAMTVKCLFNMHSLSPVHGMGAHFKVVSMDFFYTDEVIALYNLQLKQTEMEKREVLEKIKHQADILNDGGLTTQTKELMQRVKDTMKK
jgi:hypothetical protein